MLIILGILLLGFCLAGVKFFERLLGVVLGLALFALIALKVLKVF